MLWRFRSTWPTVCPVCQREYTAQCTGWEQGKTDLYGRKRTLRTGLYGTLTAMYCGIFTAHGIHRSKCSRLISPIGPISPISLPTVSALRNALRQSPIVRKRPKASVAVRSGFVRSIGFAQCAMPATGNVLCFFLNRIAHGAWGETSLFPP